MSAVLFYFIWMCLIPYCAGSIPFGLILTTITGAGDLRKIGSGNIGATNVLRTGRKGLAALTLFLDFGKGYLGGWLASALITEGVFDPAFSLLVGFFVVLGHCFPIWLRFRGGKGVATSLGVLAMATPSAALAAFSVWLMSAFITRYSSLSALMAALVAPISASFLYSPDIGLMCVPIAILVWVRHIPNIKRLIKGEESKIGTRAKESAS